MNHCLQKLPQQSWYFPLITMSRNTWYSCWSWRFHPRENHSSNPADSDTESSRARAGIFAKTVRQKVNFSNPLSTSSLSSGQQLHQDAQVLPINSNPWNIWKFFFIWFYKDLHLFHCKHTTEVTRIAVSFSGAGICEVAVQMDFHLMDKNTR